MMLHARLTSAFLAAGLMLFATAAPSAAAGRQITFKLPVKLMNVMPQVKFYRGYCSVAGKGKIVATGKSDWTPLTMPASGPFSATVTVVVTVPENEVPTLAQWNCRLEITDDKTHDACITQSMNPVAYYSDRPYCQPKAGTEKVPGPKGPRDSDYVEVQFEHLGPARLH
ncbi:MAG: hypothetical protein FJX20_09490 [Alphaproteobacteria bacterium]|nr:hypothetical protein [Alphaproteobacteria bacterium]